jgi:hypothetical protein
MRRFKSEFHTSLGVWTIAGQLIRDPAIKPKRKKSDKRANMKLTDEQVAEMRRRREVGMEKIADLAREYDITVGYAEAILSYLARPICSAGKVLRLSRRR